MQVVQDRVTPRGGSAHVVVSLDEAGRSVSISGWVAASTVGEVRQVLMAAAENGTGDLVVDLGGVERIDASGLGVLVGAHRLAMRQDRRLVLRSVPTRIERILAATRLNRVLTVEAAG